jgi:hypothetical protein
MNNIARKARLPHTGFLLGLLFNPKDEGEYVPPKYRLTFDGLPGITSQEIKHYITKAVETSYSTKW